MALPPLLAGAAATLLSMDVLQAIKAWNMAPALVERRETVLPSVAALWGKVRMRGKRRDAALWEETCYSLAFHLRAGETPSQAVRGVGMEGESFAHMALRSVTQAYDAGTSLQVALAAEAYQYPELGQITGVLEMGGVSGGNIPSLLCHAAEAMRRRRLQRGELRSRLTEARATAILLSLLPWAIGAFTFSQDPRSIEVMLQDPKGRTLLVVAAVTWLAGNVAVAATLRALLPRRPNTKKGEAPSWH